ncbi:MAG: hypothetical protein KFB93_05110 [Simkaniaceae bacterium]|nr:MAG: hypothetical protein KFB93_05110 [Simkaniaceae bacterium]
MVPNLIPTYPRVNEAAKDLMTAALGVGLLRLAGMRLEVGQLNIKTLAFGALTTATGAALGREAILRGFEGVSISKRENRNEMNHVPIALAILTVAAAATLAVTQYSRVGSHLPSFTQLDRNQALALGGSAIGSMVGMRYFGFADQAKAVRTPPPRAPLYAGEQFNTLGVAQMLDVQGQLDRKEISFDAERAHAWNAQVEVLVRASEEHSDQLKTLRV